MPGGARPKQMGRYYELRVEEFIRNQAGIPITRIWGSGMGRENPKIDLEASSSYFPKTLQVKHKTLPKWLGDDIKSGMVEATVICEAGGRMLIVQELGLYIHYCRLPEET